MTGDKILTQGEQMTQRSARSKHVNRSVTLTLALVVMVFSASALLLMHIPKPNETPSVSPWFASNPALATLSPALTAKPSSGVIGTSITFTGANYTGNSLVTVSWSGGTACAAYTNPQGSFNCTYVISVTPAGEHTFTAADTFGDTAMATFTVIPRLTVSPLSGPAGTLVTFSWTGFDALSCGYYSCNSYSVSWMSGSSSACSTRSDDHGSGTCTYTIPPGTPGGNYTFTGADGTPHTAFATFNVTYTSRLTAKPSSGFVGTVITFKGTSYAANNQVTVSWSGGFACGAPTDTAGSFSCTYRISATNVGDHTFTATDGNSGSAIATFAVIPRLTITPQSGPAGTTVSFSWTGFNPLNCGYYSCNAYSVSWMSGSVGACDTRSDDHGSGSCTYTIPAGTPVDNYTFTGADETPHTAFATFNLTYTPKLTATPSSGVGGTVIVFKGTGFASNDQATVSWSGGFACGAPTDTVGGFGCTFSIPAATVGDHTFTATDGNSGSAVAIFTVIPRLTVSPLSGPAGATVVFSWTGFNPLNCGYYSCNSYLVSWMSGSVVACSTRSDDHGSGNCAYTIPAGTPVGNYTFTGADETPHVAFAPFEVKPSPSMAVSPSSGGVGTTITFSGANYTANSRIIISMDNTGNVSCSQNADIAGSFTCRYTIPGVTSGSHSFSGIDSTGLSAIATFRVTQQIALSPGSGPVGTTFTLSATGFTGSSPFTIIWTGGYACSGITNDGGTFVCSYSVPMATSGVHNFTGTDSSSNSAIGSFTITPQVRSSRALGVPGDLTMFNATGFAGNSIITISWTGGIACSGLTNGVGGFLCPYKIGAATAGAHSFTGRDSSGDSSTAILLVASELEASPSFGFAGSTVTFTGVGFADSSLMMVSWSGGAVCSGPTNNNGTFSCVFTIPGTTPAGSYQFTGTDASVNTANSAFVVAPSGSATSNCLSGPYTINFTESDLPSSALPWSVSVNGCPKASSSTHILFQIPNGTGYVYTISPVSGYNASSYTGIFNITGRGMNISIRWTPFKGEKGDPGQNGINGTNGTNGIQGVQGVQGTQGPPGNSEALIAYVAVAVAGVAIGASALALASSKRKRQAT